MAGLIQQVLLAVMDTQEQEYGRRSICARFGKGMLNVKTEEGGEILQLLTVSKPIRQLFAKPHHIQNSKFGNKKVEKKARIPKKKELKIKTAVLRHKSHK